VFGNGKFCDYAFVAAFLRKPSETLPVNCIKGIIAVSHDLLRSNGRPAAESNTQVTHFLPHMLDYAAISCHTFGGSP